jgi:hypothetical protein
MGAGGVEIMTNAVIARQQGDDYQSRHFWLQGCRLFQKHSAVERVGFEIDSPRAFDDVAVWYGRAVPDGRGGGITAEFYQVKFHVTPAGAVTWEAFLDPGFIGATSICLLERVHEAYERMRAQKVAFRLNLVLPWQVHPDCPLAKVITSTSGILRLPVLFDGTGPRGKMGRIRTAWREKLGLASDDDLAKVLGCLAVVAGAGSLSGLGDRLNDKLQLAGFSPLADWRLGNPYDDLIRKLHAEGRTVFTRDDLQEIAQREGLWRGTEPQATNGKRVGIRSFLKWAEHMEDETESLLCLVRHFDGRRIRPAGLWDTAVFPELSAFLANEAQGSRPVTMQMDTHGSVAFVAGYCLDAKAGTNVAIVQRTNAGTVVWPACNPGGGAGAHLWECTDIACGGNGDDVAIGLSVTHDISADVQLFTERCLRSVGRMLHLRILPGISATAIRDGSHAASLAQEVIARVRASRTIAERGGVLHIFTAAPNGLLFRMGQLSRSLGRLQLYEYDFDTVAPGAYQPSMVLPNVVQACEVAGVKQFGDL